MSGDEQWPLPAFLTVDGERYEPVFEREKRLAALRSKLQELAKLPTHGESHAPHLEADRALLDFIADPAVTAAFEALDKWY